MRKVTAAEWLLSLFTTPDRASAVAGDLLEQRGSFWFNTLRTAGALLLKSAVARPFRLLLIILLGYLVHSGVTTNAWVSHITRGHTPLWWLAWRLAVAPATMGYVVARFARGSEVAACLGVAVIEWSLFGVGIGHSHMAAAYFALPPAVLAWFLFHFTAPGFVLICAGAWTRKRRYAH
jgi:hypothetical protein